MCGAKTSTLTGLDLATLCIEAGDGHAGPRAEAALAEAEGLTRTIGMVAAPRRACREPRVGRIGKAGSSPVNVEDFPLEIEISKQDVR